MSGGNVWEQVSRGKRLDPSNKPPPQPLLHEGVEGLILIIICSPRILLLLLSLLLSQSKFISQVITEKLQCNNVVALERLPEKHYAH